MKAIKIKSGEEAVITTKLPVAKKFGKDAGKWVGEIVITDDWRGVKIIKRKKRPLLHEDHREVPSGEEDRPRQSHDGLAPAGKGRRWRRT